MTPKPRKIVTRRIYEEPGDDDGVRVLVDRLWPRGISKERARLDAWMKDIAPSDALRKTFHGHPDKWEAFVKAYASELKGRSEELDRLKEMGAGKRLTLLYAAKDEERNNAVALKGILEKG